MAAAILLAFAGLGVYAWREFGDVELGANGYLALILGAGFTAVVGVGLMALVFFSAYRGYDDDIGKPGKPREDD